MAAKKGNLKLIGAVAVLILVVVWALVWSVSPTMDLSPKGPKGENAKRDQAEPKEPKEKKQRQKRQPKKDAKEQEPKPEPKKPTEIPPYDAFDKDKITAVVDRGSKVALVEDLEQILVVRDVGSANHGKVRDYIKSHFEGLKWTVEEDSFEETTPLGKKKFTNIIATHNPKAKKNLVFGAHYDSKYFDNFTFYAAVDSAAPVSMMLQMSRSLNSILPKGEVDVGLQMIFFDGEESFGEWSETDSLYGSKHLAAKWEAEDKLRNIDLLVVLDLLGAKLTETGAIYSMYSFTTAIFLRLNIIEKKFKQFRLRESRYPDHLELFSSREEIADQYPVDDDDKPFLKKGVRALHVIPLPFPKVWHSPGDNRTAIDDDNLFDLTNMVSVFAAEWLKINPLA